MNPTKIQISKATYAFLLSGLLTTGLLAAPAAKTALPPGSGTFAYTGGLNVARYNHTATLLPSGGSGYRRNWREWQLHVAGQRATSIRTV